MRALAYRIVITIINIFFPPLSVYLLCGAHWDFILNCTLLLLAIVPAHVHGFYLSCTYFHRRHKVGMYRSEAKGTSADRSRLQVKKGQYPGGPKPLIHSQNVTNGGASNAEVDRLWRIQQGGLGRTSSRRSNRGSMSSRQEPQMVQRQSSNRGSMSGRKEPQMVQRQGSKLSKGPSNSGRRYDGYVDRDGYGPAQPAQQRCPSTRNTHFRV